LKPELVDASPKMGDAASGAGHRQEQPEEVLATAGLRRCERASSQRVRQGDQGDLTQSAGHQGPVHQREHLRQQPRRVQRGRQDNKYRPVVEVKHQAGIVWVKFVGTRAQ
jgi:hypothetical protein